MCCEAPLRLCVHILQQTEVSKTPKVLPFYNFVSLRYSADFGCSRLVSIYTHKYIFSKLIEILTLISGVKRHIRIFDVIFELYCILLTSSALREVEKLTKNWHNFLMPNFSTNNSHSGFLLLKALYLSYQMHTS